MKRCIGGCAGSATVLSRGQQELQLAGLKGDFHRGLGFDGNRVVVDAHLAGDVDLEVNLTHAARRHAAHLARVFQPRLQDVQQSRALLDRGADEVETSIGGTGMRREFDARTRAPDVEDFDQQKLTEANAAIETELRWNGAHFVREGSGHADVTVQFVFWLLEFIHRVGVDFLQDGDRPADEADTDAFDEVTFTPWPGYDAHVKGPFSRRSPTLNDFLRPKGKSETAGDVVGRPERQRREGPATPDQRQCRLADGTVAARDDHKIALFQQLRSLERAIQGKVRRIHSGTADQLQQIAARPTFITGFFVVKQDGIHGLWRQTGGNQARSWRTRVPRMRILVSNDDGIYSPGIAALAEVASRFGDVRVVAPDVEQSSMSHAITSSRPLSYRRTPISYFEGRFEAYRVNGTPADCVALGTHNWAGIKVVLSGINLGTNLGSAVWHSGTLAAAKQAALLGVRGIAVSTPTTDTEPDFPSLVPWVERTIRMLLTEGDLPLVNVNIPVKPRGICWTRQSIQHYDGRVVPAKDPMGRQHFWYTVVPIEQVEEGTDRWAMERGYVSVTPLRLDLTDDVLLGHERTRLGCSKDGLTST